MHGEIDAEALLDAVDELLAEGNADIGDGDAFSVAHDRRHGENAQRIPSGFDADDRFAGLVRLHHGARRAEMSSPNSFGAWTRKKAVAGGVWKLISGIPCGFNAASGRLQQRPSASRSPLATASATGGRWR